MRRPALIGAFKRASNEYKMRVQFCHAGGRMTARNLFEMWIS